MPTRCGPVRLFAAGLAVACVTGTASAQFVAPTVTPRPQPFGPPRVMVQPQMNTLPIPVGVPLMGFPAVGFANPYFNPAAFNPSFGNLNAFGNLNVFGNPNAFGNPGFNAGVNRFNPAMLPNAALMNVPPLPRPARFQLVAFNPAFTGNSLSGTTSGASPTFTLPNGASTLPPLPDFTASAKVGGAANIIPGNGGTFYNPQTGAVSRPGTPGFLPWIW